MAHTRIVICNALAMSPTAPLRRIWLRTLSFTASYEIPFEAFSSPGTPANLVTFHEMAICFPFVLS
jgi:hypothetical protein